MSFTSIDLPNLLFEMALFAILGLGFETVFTAVLDLKSDKRRFLMGYSSLWYLPLYALTPVFLHLATGSISELPIWMRGSIYAIVIFGVEYCGMLALRLLLGASPSEEGYQKSRWSIHGLIRLDYFPAFFLLGLAFEAVFRQLRFVVIFVALACTLTLGVGNTYAADSNTMPNLAISAEADKERLLRESQGILVEELDGEVIDEQNKDIAFNPASAVKILTAYATLKHFGPDFTFETKILVDGATDGSSFEGDIFFEGSDPFFNTASLQKVFTEFKKRGINIVDASLFVSPNFKFAGKAPGQKSANAVKGLFGGGKKRRAKTSRTVGVTVNLKSARVGTASAEAERLTVVQSETIRALTKDMLSRSDNGMAETFGNILGGPQSVAKICRADFSVTSDALSISTSSGLGVNRVSPKAMIAALRGFKQLLSGFKLKLEDALPIAGTDHGTIYKRFANSQLKGFLVGKTGTLVQTDKGASVLVGEMSTLLRGQVLFVVFQRGRNTSKLRLSQNKFLEELLAESGGPGVKYGV